MDTKPSGVSLSYILKTLDGGSGWRKFGLTLICNCFLAIAAALTANGQSVTGQISGVVADTTGGAIVSATVQLTHDLSKQSRTFTTDTNGAFVFTNLVPGDYSVRITASGFKIHEQKGVTVSAQERVDLHEIKLEAGNVAEEVTVL